MNGRVRDNSAQSGSGAGEAEETLRIIAGLHAPEGLEERVHSALKNAPRGASILRWPSDMTSGRSSLARWAAAAAIVFVVAGGGWGVYSRVQPAPSPKMIAMPRVVGPTGFSTANAIRTPQTLTGPVLTHPDNALAEKSKESNGAQKQARKRAGRSKKAVQ